MKRGAYIYSLIDPVTNETRYIGKANDPQKRLKGHIADAARRDYPVYRWIRKLISSGKCPVLNVLEYAEDWKEAEKRLIKASIEKGDKLLNVAEGGDQPFCSYEVRALNGKKNAQKIHSSERSKRIWELKRNVASAIKKGLISNEKRQALRNAAARRPDLFSIFANIPNRIE